LPEIFELTNHTFQLIGAGFYSLVTFSVTQPTVSV